jgi:hypothetical protein
VIVAAPVALNSVVFRGRFQQPARTPEDIGLTRRDAREVDEAALVDPHAPAWQNMLRMRRF